MAKVTKDGIASLASIGKLLVLGFGNVTGFTLLANVATQIAANNSKCFMYVHIRPFTTGAIGDVLYLSFSGGSILTSDIIHLDNDQEYETLLPPGKVLFANPTLICRLHVGAVYLVENMLGD